MKISNKIDSVLENCLLLIRIKNIVRLSWESDIKFDLIFEKQKCLKQYCYMFIVVFLQNTTIEYSSESLCVCVCVFAP